MSKPLPSPARARLSVQRATAIAFRQSTLFVWLNRPPRLKGWVLLNRAAPHTAALVPVLHRKGWGTLQVTLTGYTPGATPPAEGADRLIRAAAWLHEQPEYNAEPVHYFAGPETASASLQAATLASGPLARLALWTPCIEALHLPKAPLYSPTLWLTGSRAAARHAQRWMQHQSRVPYAVRRHHRLGQDPETLLWSLEQAIHWFEDRAQPGNTRLRLPQRLARAGALMALGGTLLGGTPAPLASPPCPEVNVTFSAGSLTVVGDNSDNTIAITAVGGDVKVCDADPPGGPVPANTVTFIQVQGADGDDVLDVSGVTNIDFTLNPFMLVDAGANNDIILGPNLTGGPGTQLFGGPGSDSITGGQSNDFIIGGEDNDSLDGGPGDDAVIADVTINAVANDTLLSADGDDTIGGFEAVGLFGNGDANIIDGSGLIISLFVDAGDGNDSILGGTSNDQLFGGPGNDTITGGAGNDSISGSDQANSAGSGMDSLIGGNDDDAILGFDGNDTLRGEAGNDTLSGGAGNDSLLGGGDDDTLFGDAEDDTLLGENGNDFLAGGAGANDLDGGPNQDTGFIFGTNSADNLEMLLAEWTLNGETNTHQNVETINITLRDGQDNLNIPASVGGGERNYTVDGGDDLDLLDFGPPFIPLQGTQLPDETFTVTETTDGFSVTVGQLTVDAINVETLSINAGDGDDTINTTGLTDTAQMLDAGTNTAAAAKVQLQGDELNVDAGGNDFTDDGSTITINGFQPIAYQNAEVVNILNPLPVELTAFSARTDGGDVVLNWQTATETDNAGFELQHLPVRTNGGAAQQPDEAWEILAWIPGAGTTLQAQTYHYRVPGIGVGRHLFRLKQVDFDGDFELTETVEALREVPGTHLLSAAYPNPFNPSARFTLAVSRTQPVRVTLYDALGRVVRVLHNGPLAAHALHHFRIDGSSLPSGMYMYRVDGEVFHDAQTLMLVK